MKFHKIHNKNIYCNTFTIRAAVSPENDCIYTTVVAHAVIWQQRRNRRLSHPIVFLADSREDLASEYICSSV